MSAARSGALAWSAGALGVISGLASGVFAFANWASFHDLTDISLPSVVIPLGFGVVGALVASRQPRNATGWLFICVALVAGLQGVAGGYALIALVLHPGAPGGVWALWLYSWIVTLVFPAGRADIPAPRVPRWASPVAAMEAGRRGRRDRHSGAHTPHRSVRSGPAADDHHPRDPAQPAWTSGDGLSRERGERAR